LATIECDTGNLQMLLIDQQKHKDQVQQIAHGDSFKQLQQQVRELRERRKLSDTSGDVP
jgi:hypothetical protein